MIQSNLLGISNAQRGEGSQSANDYYSSLDFLEEHNLQTMYGFNRNKEVSIPDVFKLMSQNFSQHVESQIQFADMQNGKIWLLTMMNKVIIKANLEDPSDRTREVDQDILKRKNIKKMYLGPKGLHCFLLAEHEIYYNHWKSNVVYQLNVNSLSNSVRDQPQAFKSVDICYVTLSDPDTFEILLGTDNGAIYHTCMVYQDRNGINPIDPFTKVLDTQQFRPIMDIKICKVLGKILILAVTDSILYQFLGEFGLKSTLEEYNNNQKLMKEHAINIDINTKRRDQESFGNNYFQMKLFLNPQTKSEMGFGWMTEYQFCYAIFNTQQGEIIIKRKNLNIINYLKKESEAPIENEPPMDFAMSQFHIIFMYKKNITVLSNISNEIVYYQNFENQNLSGIQYDEAFNRLIIYGNKDVMLCFLKEEGQDAWKYYLKRAMIKEAIQYCKTPKQKALVSGIYAESLFQKGKYELAAEYYAKSEKTFEEVTLKFLKDGLYVYLENYLQKILEKIDKKREDLRPQRVLLCTWIVELKLNEINSYQSRIEQKKDDLSKRAAEDSIQLLQKNFHEFLQKHSTDIHQDTIFQVLQSHGKIDECIKFAENVQNYETVIIHYLNKQEFEMALQKNCEITDEKMRNDIMLRYASVFIKNVPKQVIAALRSNSFKIIDIPKLIPAFINLKLPEQDFDINSKSDKNYEKLSRTEALQDALNYIMDHCINKMKSREKTVHNLAFFFYANKENPEDLLNFLQSQESRKLEGHPIFFEVDYALNVCKQKEKDLKDKWNQISEKMKRERVDEKKREQTEQKIKLLINQMKKAQIILYAILGLFDKAVKLALECEDIQLAKVYADKPNDKKQKKKLWMKIAKHLFNYQGGKDKDGQLKKISSDLKKKDIDVSAALAELKDSVLKIDDMLQLFPEDAKVEDMKKHLCDCLDEYNNKIQDLKQQLEEHSKNAEILRKQQRKQKHKHITITPNQMCDICFKTIFNKEFYVFPCLHAFHRDYKTKDIKVRTLIGKIMEYYGIIEGIQGKAQYLQSNMQTSGSMLAGLVGMGGAAEEELGKSFLSDIKSFFGSMAYKGQPGSGITAQMSQTLQQKDLEEIRRCYNTIDDILTRECLFCGSILIDMIDNDVSADQRDYEFYQGEEAPQILGIEEEDEWLIN